MDGSDDAGKGGHDEWANLTYVEDSKEYEGVYYVTDGFVHMTILNRIWGKDTEKY